jgi:excisionase family DNA binding protein
METSAEPPRSLADGDWLSTTEAARRLGLASRTVYRLIDIGDLPAYRLGCRMAA